MLHGHFHHLLHVLRLQAKAVSLAAKIKDALDEDAFLIEGAGGIFDVNVNGKLVYSKHQTGDFPNEDALVGELQAL